jgi:hypothetical protein
MDNLARMRQPEVFQEIGTVARADGDAFVVRTDSGEHRLRRAAGCLLAPAPYDTVLVVRVGGGGYVLSVLEREEGTAAELTVDGDLAIRPTGRLQLAAQAGVHIASGEEVAVVAPRVAVRAEEGDFSIAKLRHLGAELFAEVAKLDLTAGTFHALVDRVTSRVKRSFRTVEELDQLKAHRIDHAAEESLSLHGRNAMLTAEELIKLDGDQVHIG